MPDLFKGVKDLNEGEKEEVLPDQLKGKSPEEVYKALQGEYDRLLQQLEVEKAKQEGANSVQQTVSTPSVQPAPVGGSRVDNMWTDPQAFIDQQLQERIGPIVQDFAQNLRTSNREMFRNKLGEGEWEQFGEEIEKLVDGFAPIIQKNPEAYKTAYNFVRGMHVDEIVEKQTNAKVEEVVRNTLKELGFGDRINEVITEEKPPQNLFQRNVGIPVVSSGRKKIDVGKLKPTAKLTPEEMRVAKGMGISFEDYAKSKEEIYGG